MVRKKIKKKEKEKTWGLSLFIVTIMVLSVMGFALLNRLPDSGLGDFRGMELSQNEDGTWDAEYQKKEYMFFYHPTDVTQYFLNELSFDSEYAIVTSDLVDNEERMQYLSFAKHLTAQQLEENSITVINAFTEEFEELPVFGCMNASAAAPVLYFTIANKTTITESNNCYTITAKTDRELFRVRDAFVYSYLFSE